MSAVTLWLEHHKWVAVLLAFPIGLVVVGACAAGFFGALFAVAYVAPIFKPLAPLGHVLGKGALWLLVLVAVWGAGMWALEKLGVDI